PGGAGDQFDSYQGTSMACPHVAGAAALLWSLNPDYTYQEIRDALLNSAAPNPALDGKSVTGGELDLFAAIAALGPQLTLDRQAYRSDATVEVTVNDPTLIAPLPTDVDVAVEVVDPLDVVRWASTETLLTVGVDETTFTNSFDLVSGTTAVEDDTLTVTYESPSLKTASISVLIDDTPPVISDVQMVDVAEDFATVGWSTDEPADSRYILTTEIPPGGLDALLPEIGGGTYVSTPTVIGATTQYVHTVTVPVEGSTKYVMAVLSEDYAGNKASAPTDLTSTNEEDYLTFITPVRRTVYENDMESGEAGWTFTNLNDVTCWEYGMPSYGPPGATSGERLWGTVLDGNYPLLALASLVSTPVAVKLSPRLEFQSWHQFAESDFGVIEVNGGSGWVNVTELVTGSSAGWQAVSLDLPGFANQTIRVRFRIESGDEGVAAGWYIDDVRISNVLPPGINIIGYEIDDAAGGDGDGHAEPGESFFLNLEVFNSMQTQIFSNVQASVTVPTPEVTLTPATSYVLYGDLQPGDSALSGTQLALSTEVDIPQETPFTVFHSATADGGLGPYPDMLTLEIATRESVYGLVTNLFTGAPIEEALIRGQASGYPDVMATSEADGSYGLHGLVPGVAYDIQALKPGEYSPSDVITATGPSMANFGLGTAWANAAPLIYEWEVNEGESALDTLSLDNAAGDLPLSYEIVVDVAAHPAMTEVPIWLTTDPSAGVVPVGAGAPVALTADASALAASEQPYEAVIRLMSNDAGGEDILIPASLTVMASPTLYVYGVRVTGGDGDAFAEPGEAVDMDIMLANSGSLLALSLEGVLSYTGADATTVTQPNASWAHVLPGGVEGPVLDPPLAEYPQIQIDPLAGEGDVLPFSLEVTDADARVTTHTFDLTVTVRYAISGQVTDLDTTDPVEGAVVKAVSDRGTVQTLTDAAGDYSLFGLTNNTYDVYVLPPAPYGAPPSSNVVIATANAENVDFEVAAWGISALPTNIVVNLPEGVETNLTLDLTNDGPYAGFVEIGLELVQGVPHDRIGSLDLPEIDWTALPSEAVEQELLVRFEDGSAIQAQASALAAVGGQVLRRYHGVSAAHVRVPGNLSMEWVANTLTTDAAIRYVEPNYRREVFAVPNDALYSQMYGLDNTRQTGGTLAEDIRAQEAWDTTVGNTNVVIAVMDTGVKLDHVDLADNLVAGYDFGDDDPDPSPDPVAGVEHGTHVAGTVGASGGNGIGVAGVNWHSKIMPLKVATVGVNELGIEEAVLSSDAILAALEYAVDNGVKISNHSYGGYYFSGVEYEMIEYAMANEHLFVAAAGNEAVNNDDDQPYRSYPASYNLDNIISVAATDHDGALADFSNYGAQSVDIAAPGVDILSTYMYGTLDAYERLSGTSMAAPHVAGVAGLLKSVAPWATYDMLRDAIMLGARRDPVLEGVVSSAGHLDAAAALEHIQAFWLQVDTHRANIVSLDTLSVGVTINAGGQLPAGSYIAHIVVRGGANELSIPVTVNVAPAPVPVITDVAVDDQATGDGDRHAEPAETVDLFIRLLNDGSALYMSPTGTLTSTTPGVTIVQGTATWPGISSGDQQVNLAGFRVTLPNATGDVDFTLTLANGVLPFTLPVAPRQTISGTVRDALTAAGLAGLTVEYWGASSGRVLTESNGSYRIDGLEDGTYRFRVLGESHETPPATIRTLVGGNQIADFSLRRPEIAFGATQMVFAAQAGQDQEQTLLFSNLSVDEFEFDILTAQPRKIALISDRNALALVQPVLEQAGWTVSMWSNNLVTVEGVLTGRHSTDPEAILPQDLVILDLGGTAGTGRLLSVAEESLLQTYLNQGGKLIVVGAHVLSRPDDRRLRDLVGSDSLDRAPEAEDMAELVQALPIDPFWVDIQPGDHVAVTSMAYDEATVDTNEAPAVYFGVEGASKLMRRETGTGGVVILWNGNQDAAEWQTRGAWQDVLRGLVENELLEAVPWLNASPVSASVDNSELPVTLKAESAGLTIGLHEAVLIIRGNYPGAVVQAIPVTFNVVQPTLRVQSSTGVKNWMNQFLSGTGGAEASLFQLVYAGPDGVVNLPASDGSTTGDDTVLFTFPFNKNHGRIGVGYEWLPELGRFDEIFHHDFMETTPVRNVYVRAWDAATFEGSVAYGDSGVYALDLSANETHDFGTWVVDQVLGYPGSLATVRDSNGDSIPDGYCILNGMDPRAPIVPLEAEWTLEQVAGTIGSETNQFHFPTRLFLTNQFVFVLDRQNNRVSVWDRTTLTHVLTYGSDGTNAGQFATPYGLGKAPNADRFAVADSANHRIQVFTFNPTTGAVVFERQFGSYGSAVGQFNNPRDVAIGPLGRFYVADKDNHRVQVFDPNGVQLFSFGVFGTANGQMNSPQGITVDEHGIVYVADTENNRLQGFTSGGTFLWKTGSFGTGAGQFNKPMSIQIGLGNRLFVADTSNHRIQVLDSSRAHVGSLGQQGGGDGQVSFPHDAAPSLMSSSIIVADTWNNRLQKLEATVDGDGDGMDDAWEVLNGLDPTNPLDALLDDDGDGLLNIGEFRLQTDPQNPDTDGDGWDDGQEVAHSGDPTDPAVGPFVANVSSSTPFSVRWLGRAGAIYTVQSSSNLPSGEWGAVPGAVFTATVDGVMGYTNTMDEPLQFFRPVRIP
ncbi:MAG: S8 family serine peptidase, partial [Kiritimatiellia bacterium]|nr:S8 family serine peptidase [Kiritimatiellia bacterium]